MIIEISEESELEKTLNKVLEAIDNLLNLKEVTSHLSPTCVVRNDKMCLWTLTVTLQENQEPQKRKLAVVVQGSEFQSSLLYH